MKEQYDFELDKPFSSCNCCERKWDCNAFVTRKYEGIFSKQDLQAHCKNFVLNEQHTNNN